jgi:hypothetical protein
MPRNPSHVLIAAAALVVAGCATSATPASEAAAMPTDSTIAALNMMPVKEWPLRFRSHSFSVYCYDTYGCKVVYAGQLQLDEDDQKLQPSSAGYGPAYRRNWSGVYGMIWNFPAPAEVTWRSKDGQRHHAKIDIAELFKDELIRHEVSREDMADVPNGEFPNEPAVLMEVNNRVIRVYMRAHIPTKQLQKPGNRYSDFRNDLILIRTYNY